MTMVINGDGSITGLSAGGLPDATVTQSDLASGVAGTGPAFHAYQTVSQTGIAAVTNTKVTFTTEVYDTASCYDTATSRFTPNVAGYYQINASVSNTSPVNTTGLQATLRKNGAAGSGNGIGGSTSTGAANQIYAASVVSGLVYLNGSTDYVEVYIYCGSSTTSSTYASSSVTYFQGCLVKAA